MIATRNDYDLVEGNEKSQRIFDFTIQHFYDIIELKTTRYVTKIEYVDGKGGGTASFPTPNGTYESVQLYDYRIVYTDEDAWGDVGDIMKVQEYKDIFDQSYYVFVEEVH